MIQILSQINYASPEFSENTVDCLLLVNLRSYDTTGDDDNDKCVLKHNDDDKVLYFL